MNAPKLPDFDKKKFPDVSWLPRFYELLKPFFEGVASNLGSVSSPVMLGSDIPITIGNEGGLTTPVFIQSSDPRGLLLLTATLLDSQGRDTGEKVTVSCTWKLASQGANSGLQVTAIQGLISGARYRLTVWGLSG